MTTLYVCDGYWNGDPSDFFKGDPRFFGMMVSDGTWDEIEDEKDEAIFFYTDGKPVVGDHGEFVITSAEVYAHLGDV